MPEGMERPRLIPGRQSAGERLSSWKDIAAYLGREQRTVQRWERTEGLPVHRLQHGKAGSVYALKSELDAWVAARSGEPARPSPVRRRSRSPGPWVGALAVIAFLAAAGGWLLTRRTGISSAATPVPLTSDAGTELEPRLSPTGTQVAYVWNGESEDNFDIYVRMPAGGAPLRLTTDPARDYSPAWSPDGTSIAFLRASGTATATLLVVPALGGTERKVAQVTAALWPHWPHPGPFLAWSPDGKWLVTSGREGSSRGETLLRVSPATGEIQPLTPPPANGAADAAPAFSPDGTTLAFSRLVSWGRSELCLLPLSQALLPAGEVRKLNTGSTWNASPAWFPDGRSLVFSTGSMDAPYLARIEAAGSGGAQRLLGAGDYGWLPSLARAQDGRVRLVYTQHFESVNIWRNSLDGASAPVRLIASAHWNYEPAWSADGRRIVFLSDRTGYGEIWVADADGRHLQQWTFLKQPRLGSPRWSPDGRRIAFTAPGARGSSIYVIQAPGSAPRLVRGSEDSGYLEWAPDGQAIYFSSSRASEFDIWKVAVEGGAAVRVYHRGRVPAVSSDGRYLYFMRPAGGGDGTNDLWRVPLAGGQEEKVLNFVDAYSLADTGISFKYYRAGPQPAGPYLEFFRFASGVSERLPAAPRPLRYGIALSRDARYLLHSQADYQVSDLMLVEDFR